MLRASGISRAEALNKETNEIDISTLNQREDVNDGEDMKKEGLDHNQPSELKDSKPSEKNIAKRVSNNISQTQEMKDKTDDNENSKEHYLRNICDLDLTENNPENLQKGNVATYNIEDIPIVIVLLDVQLNDFSYNDSLTAENLQILSDCEEIENISLNVELNHSNENRLIADYGDISFECKSNSNKKSGNLHEYLIWPETLHRTDTPKLQNRLDAKIKEKAELEKLERKQKRIENKENKLLTQKEKKPRKGISKVNVISNVTLLTTENSLRSEKTMQPENHIRRLFEDDSNTSSVVTQKSEANGILQSLSSFCFVNSGLCYMNAYAVEKPLEEESEERHVDLKITAESRQLLEFHLTMSNSPSKYRVRSLGSVVLRSSTKSLL
ncbi:hypothetical protein ILUMI_01257 [Ignelater luminosus]|uniref:Uncharacterized protein n=1 Tax=Ignelater luminosus TaxID=2038154 RepID=A0A8K0GPE2_IGNLU|nr:hypothetical protein ILUMI_01257 [Ignelater luminosus]